MSPSTASKSPLSIDRPARFAGVKLGNEYAAELGALYQAAPKAVLAAIAVSFATTGGDYIERAHAAVLREWWALYRAGIVPQKPSEAEPAADVEESGC